MLRVTDGLNGTVLVAQQPVKVVNHCLVTTPQYNGIDVLMTYGLNFNPFPTPGDTEQFYFYYYQIATTHSPEATERNDTHKRIERDIHQLQRFYCGPDTRAGSRHRMHSMILQASETWIQQAILILPQNIQVVEDFIKLSCFTSKSTAKAYWMVPYHPLTVQINTEESSSPNASYCQIRLIHGFQA